jgi:hypothetical protein
VGLEIGNQDLRELHNIPDLIVNIKKRIEVVEACDLE